MIEQNVVELHNQLSKLKAELSPTYMHSDDFKFVSDPTTLRNTLITNILINSLEATIVGIEKTV